MKKINKKSFAKNGSSKLIAPSLLSADFANLAKEVKEVEEAGADWLHIDVMDGHFVPNLTIGPLVVEALNPITKLPLDCHLMVAEPEKWVSAFAKAGASIITVHAEATHHLDRLIHQIREAGCKVGVSINPATPVSVLSEVLAQVDLVLVMSVNPGFGGQKFIPSTLKKISELAEIRRKNDLTFVIEIDGGVSAKNITAISDAGCDVFVAGSSVFGEADRKKAIQVLRKGLK